MMVVTDETFEKEVLGEKTRTVLVDFGATWCGPCKMLKPIVEGIAKEHPELKVVYIDIDSAPRTVMRYGVRAAPTLLVFRNGEKQAVQVGAVPKERILGLVETPLQNAP